MTQSRQEPVAIVGMGGWFPPGVDVDGLWRMVLGRESASAVVPPSRWGTDPSALLDSSGTRPDSVLSTRACLLTELPAGSEDPGSALARRAGTAAITGVRLPDATKMGVILGHIALPTRSSMARQRAEAESRLQGLAVRSAGESIYKEDFVNPSFAPARELAGAVGARGVCYTLDAACASTYYAIALAVGELRRGRADLMLAGGVSCPDPLYTQTGFSRLKALSPSGICSPFDQRADGLVVGEGAGVFALRRLSDAVAAGDRILGVIVGTGLSNDPSGHLLTPSSIGQVDAMRRAHAASGWSPDMVDYVECHAPGTPLGDRVEFASLCEVWSGTPAGSCVLGSVKANVGHMLTAAGTPALAKMLRALAEGVLPPATGFSQPAHGIELTGSPFRVPTEASAWHRRGQAIPRRVALSGFGFGGVNAHICVEEYLDTRTVVSFERVAPPTLAVLEREFVQLTDPSARPEQFHLAIPPTELEGMLPQQMIAWQAASRVIARLESVGTLPERTGVFLGAGLDPRASRFFLRHLVDEPWRDHVHPPLDAGRTLGALVSLAPSRIAREFKFTGPAITLSAGSLSGLAALQVAMDALERDEIELAVVGAVEADEAVGPPHAVFLVIARLQVAARAGFNPRAILRAAACEGGPFADGANLCQTVEAALTPSENHPGQVQAWLMAGGDEAETALVELLAPRSRRDSVISARRVFSQGIPDHTAGLALVHELMGCLEEQKLPEAGPGGTRPSPLADPGVGDAWLRASPMEPRTGAACALDPMAGCAAVFLEECALAAETLSTNVPACMSLHACEADDVEGLLSVLESGTVSGLHERPAQPEALLGIALMPRTGESLRELSRLVAGHLRSGGHASLDTLSSRFEGRVRGSASPVRGRVALVFPGSGSSFAGMGRALAAEFPALAGEDLDQEVVRPDIFWRGTPEAVASASPCQKILAQVALGRLTTRALEMMNVPFSATLGYSLGESTQLVATSIWPDLEGLRQDLLLSSLFTHDLVSPWRAARLSFRLKPDDDLRWVNALLLIDAHEAVRALSGQERVFLLASLAPGECVIGGDEHAVMAWLKPLSGRFTLLADSTAGHCALAKPCAEAYRQLHHRHAQPRPGMDIYFSATGNKEPHEAAALATALVRGILEPLNLPRVVRRMHDDGVRIFLEAGPGIGMTRWIGKTLAGIPHACAAIHPPGRQDLDALSQALALLITERGNWAWSVAPESVGQSAPVRTHASGSSPGVLFGGPKPLVIPAVSVVKPIAPPVNAPMVQPVLPVAPPVTAAPDNVPTNPMELGRWPEALEASRDAHGAWLTTHAAALERLSRLQELAALEGESPNNEPNGLVSTEFIPDVRYSMSWEQCLSFAKGSVADAMGTRFAPIDTYPSRVRLPDEPLLLVHRVIRIEGEPCSMTSGRVVTEHDVRADAWYLDQGAIPLAVSVEAGQADMLLAGWLGIDFHTKGLANYRLLDAEVTFHGPRPTPGSTIVYDIRVDRFFRHGETYLFRFRYDATVNGQLLLSMREGCAGFFSPRELADGKGLVARPQRVKTDEKCAPIPAPAGAGSLDAGGVAALRRGDIAGAFGSSFSGLALAHPPCLPSGKLALLDRVPEFDPTGGACGLGFIAAELDIHADDWHMVCHFVDDRVMPGTLMYEACAQTLRILMWRWGWLGEEGTWRAEPTPGVTSSLRCRGQVIPGCRVLRYEITVTGRSHETCPRALADAVLLVDGKPVVSIENMAISFVGLQAESIDRLWSGRVFGPASTYNYDRILAYCIGKPSEAFGEPYRIFDQGRIIARLPGPPYLFLDRIEAVDATPWKLLADARATGAYDVPQAPWYCAEAGQPGMPFAVLLEVALQVCGWLAAHGGAALLSPTDVSFRNLGGKAVRHQPVLPGSGALVTTVTQTKVSRSAGMIILEYDLDTRMNGGLVYTGQTSFGFFPKEALARQVGIAEARPWRPDPSEVLVFQPVPTGAGLPRDRWQMLDLFAHLPAGGPHGLGWLEGRTEVDPEAWFFEAHFYQDPVWPGSLGLEAFLQLLHYDCLSHWGPGTIDLVDGTEHRWTYRGQVTPGIRHVTVLAEIISRDPSTHELEGRGWLCVGDKIIYGMEGFRVRWTSGIAGTASAR